MTNSQVFYEVCDAAPNGEWEPMGLMYGNKLDAEQALRKKRPHVPTAFLVRIVMTRCDAGRRQRALKAV